MKRFLSLFVIITIGFLVSGCATWHGVKQDSSKAWYATKKTIHNATR